MKQLLTTLCPVLLFGLISNDCCGQQTKPTYAGLTGKEWSNKISNEMDFLARGYKDHGFAIIDDANPDALPVLCELLGDKNWGTRIVALIGIGKLKKKGKLAVSNILPLLQDENPECRRFAIETLSELGETQHVKPLLELLSSDENVPVKCAAATALLKIGGHSEEIIKSLAKVLKGTDPGQLAEIPVRCIEILMSFPKGVELIHELVPLLLKPDAGYSQDMRARLFELLGREEKPSKVTIKLIEMGLADPKSRVQLQASMAFWRVTKDSQKAQSILQKIFEDPLSSDIDSNVAIWEGLEAVQSLGKDGNRFKEKIRKISEANPDPDNRKKATETLKKMLLVR